MYIYASFIALRTLLRLLLWYILQRYTILDVIWHNKVYKGYKGSNVSVVGGIWATSGRLFGLRLSGARFVPYICMEAWQNIQYSTSFQY